VGVEDVERTSKTDVVDAVSDGLKEVILLESEIEPAGVLWFVMGRALACSTLTPVLAKALGGVALKPRSAKLIVREIREAIGAGVFFSAGFMGDMLLPELGLLGVVIFESILRGPECTESFSSAGFVS
jgi:hypothetical protein